MFTTLEEAKRINDVGEMWFCNYKGCEDAFGNSDCMTPIGLFLSNQSATLQCVVFCKSLLITISVYIL